MLLYNVTILGLLFYLIFFAQFYYNSKRGLGAPLFFLLFVLAAALVSSRKLLVSQSDDLWRYYETYIQIKDQNLISFLGETTREPLFQAYNWLIYQAFGDALSERGYLLVAVIPSSLFLCLFVSKIAPARIRFFVLTSVIFAPSIVGVESQLIRQSLGIFIFLYAMTLKGSARAVFITLSILAHYILLVFVCCVFGVYLYLRLFKSFFMRVAIVAIVLLACFLIRGGFENIVELLTYSIFSTKFNFMTGSTKESVAIGVMLFAAMVSSVLYLLVFLYRLDSKTEDEYITQNVYIGFVFLFAVCIFIISGEYQLIATRISPFISGFAFLFIHLILHEFRFRGISRESVSFFVNILFGVYFLLNLRKEHDMSLLLGLYM